MLRYLGVWTQITKHSTSSFFFGMQASTQYRHNQQHWLSESKTSSYWGIDIRINKSNLLGQKEASETSLQLRMWTMKHNFFLRYCLCFGVAFLLKSVKRRNLLRRTYKNILQTIECTFIDVRIKVWDRMGTSRIFLMNTSTNRREHEKLSNSHARPHQLQCDSQPMFSFSQKKKWLEVKSLSHF